MQEIFLAFPERQDFRVVLRGARGPVSLEPVDFTLERRPLAVVAETLERPGAIGGILGRGSRLAATPAGIAPAGGSPRWPARPDPRRRAPEEPPEPPRDPSSTPKSSPV